MIKIRLENRERVDLDQVTHLSKVKTWVDKSLTARDVDRQRYGVVAHLKDGKNIGVMRASGVVESLADEIVEETNKLLANPENIEELDRIILNWCIVDTEELFEVLNSEVKKVIAGLDRNKYPQADNLYVEHYLGDLMVTFDESFDE